MNTFEITNTTFEIINVLYNTGLLDSALLNDDGSWGETIEDWETHFELLVQENYFDEDEINENTMKIETPIQFIIYYIVENLKNENIKKITCKNLYRNYIQWCNYRGEKPVHRRVFGRPLTRLGIERERSATTRYYIIDREQLIKNITEMQI